jgi:type II secretory pathway pseudopilin PulG
MDNKSMSRQKIMTPTLRKRKQSRSFTITEILVACLILTIVASFCLVDFQSSMQERKRRIAFEQVKRKVELARLLSNVLHDRIYVVAHGSLPVTITLDTASRKKAAKANILFQKEELPNVSDIVWGQNHSASGEVRIPFCNGEPSYDFRQEGEQISDVLFLKVPDCQDLEIPIAPHDKEKANVQRMKPEEIDRVFPREVVAHND